MITTLPHTLDASFDGIDSTVLYKWHPMGCSRKDLARGVTTPIYVRRTYKLQPLTEKEKEELRAEGFELADETTAPTT